MPASLAECFVIDIAGVASDGPLSDQLVLLNFVDDDPGEVTCTVVGHGERVAFDQPDSGLIVVVADRPLQDVSVALLGDGALPLVGPSALVLPFDSVLAREIPLVVSNRYGRQESQRDDRHHRIPDGHGSTPW